MGVIDETIVGLGRIVTLAAIFIGLLLLWTIFWTFGVMFIEQFFAIPTLSLAGLPEKPFGVNVVAALTLGFSSAVLTFLLGFVPSFLGE